MSAHGPGVKAGGPHYGLALSSISNSDCDADFGTLNRPHRHGPLARLWDWLTDGPAAEQLHDSQRREIEAAVVLQEAAVGEEFNQEHDTFGLVGQDNWRRYRCVDRMVIRVDQSDSMVDAIVAVSAAAAVGTQVVLSIDPAIAVSNRTLLESIADWLPGLVDPIEETVVELADRLEGNPVARLRCLSPSEYEQRKFPRPRGVSQKPAWICCDALWGRFSYLDFQPPDALRDPGLIACMPSACVKKPMTQ